MFDPYHKWLGIPREKQPATYYQLLGLQPGERDSEVIEEAAIRQSTHLRGYQIGPHAALCTRLLNEIAEAKAVLLNPAKRSAYEAQVIGTVALQRASAGRGADQRLISKPPPVPARSAPADDEREDDDLDESRRRDKRRRHQSIALSSNRGFYAKVGAGILAMLLVPFTIVAALYFVLRDSAAPERGGAGANKVVLQDAPPPLPKPGQAQPAQNAQPVVQQNQPEQGNPPQAEPPANQKPPQKIEGGLVLMENDQLHFRDPLLSPDGRYAVFRARGLCFWDLTAKKEIADQPGNFRGDAAMSADGQFLAIACEGSFEVWNVPTAKKVQSIAHPQNISTIALSPDGKTVATGSGEIDTLPNGQQRVVNGETQFKDCILRHWDVSSSKMLKSWGAHNTVITHIHITRDRILSTGAFGSFHEVDLGSGKEKLIRDNRVIRHNFSPDGSRLFGTLQDNRTLVILDTSSRQIVRQFNSPEPTPYVRWSANGKFALVTDTKDMITLWDAEKGLSLKSFAGPRVPSIAISGDGRLALVGGMGSVRVLNLD